MATKKSTLTKDKIVSMFMQDTLENNEKPKSVYHFAKANGITEAEFYTLFGGLEGVEKEIFNQFLEKTKELLNKDKDYEYYDMKSKMLSFYFTFFEMATANRSFIIHLLKEDKNPMKNLGKLTKLREVYLDYALTILEKPINIDQETVVKIQDKVLQEASWLQFLSIFNFWMNDESPNFEKTDVFIEKSVKASFDLAYNIPTQSIIDFGKFLWKEQMNGMFSKS